MSALGRVLVAILSTVKASRQPYALLTCKLCNRSAQPPRYAILTPLPDGLGIRGLHRDGREALGNHFLATELVDDLVMRVCHDAGTIGTFFQIVKMENVAQDNGDPCGQDFRMPSKTSDPYAVECGQRLERLRKALGHDSRASLARYMFDPSNEEELRREADNIRKYEAGGMPPPRFIRRLEELTQEPGIMDYVYKGTDGRLSPSLQGKVRHAERESPRDQKGGRNIPVRRLKFKG